MYLNVILFLLQLASRASALPPSIGRHSTIMSDAAVTHQQPPSDHYFEPQLEMVRTPSWLLPYPCMPCENVAAYHSFSTNVASDQTAESTAARGSAPSPKTSPGTLFHVRQDRAVVNHPPEGATYQRPGRVDRDPSSRSSSLMSHTAWSRDRPHPAAEASDFAGHLHGTSTGPLHPLKQVHSLI